MVPSVLLSGTALLSALSIVSGVPSSDVYPALEYWKALDFRANPLCSDTVATFAPPKATAYPFRAAVGLKSFAASVFTQYLNQTEGASIYDLQYQSRQQNQDRSYLGVKTCGTKKPALANAQNSLLKSAPGLPSGQEVKMSSVGDGICSCLEQTTPADMCYFMGNYSMEALCHDEYEYEDPSSVAASLSPDKDYGWVAPTCLDSISKGVDALDLPLANYIIDGNVPDELETSSMQGEGKTYYMLHKAIDHLTRYAEYEYITQRFGVTKKEKARVLSNQEAANKPLGALYDDNSIFDEILPQWKVIRVFHMVEPLFHGTANTGRFPLMTIAQRDADILIVFRDPLTTTDGRLTLYSQQAFKNLYNFTGQVHDGAATIFQAVMGVVDFTISDFYDEFNVSGLNPRIIITASGMPYSGVAAVLADHVAKKFKPILDPQLLDVSLVVFGDQLVSDAAFLTRLKTYVNVRNVVLQGDSANIFPCPTTYSCSEEHLLPRTGIKTGVPYSYAPLPGRVTIGLKSLEYTNQFWAEPTTVFDLAALRYCGLTCYLQSQFCNSDPDSRCDPHECEAAFTRDLGTVPLRAEGIYL